MTQYKEEVGAAKAYRQARVAEIETLIDKLQADSIAKRRAYFTPCFESEWSYIESLEIYRKALYDMLGWPLNDEKSLPHKRGMHVISENADDLCVIKRVEIETLTDVNMYGLLLLPHTPSPHPLVVALHGFGGTPELLSGFWYENASNYNNMAKRLLEAGFAVFAPQLFMWSEGFGPDLPRAHVDRRLKQLGGSITALEIKMLMSCIDTLSSLEDIDNERIGVMGLSYGGFYALYLSACDTRIKCCVSSCYVNNRLKTEADDWIWFNAGNRFLDAEICAMICPRPLMVESAIHDELFRIDASTDEAKRISAYYDRLGISDRFCFHSFEGVHEFSKETAPIDFMIRNMA